MMRGSVSAPTDLDRLLSVLREFGVPAWLPGESGSSTAFPVVVTLADGTPLTIEIPEPALLCSLDPLQVGLAILDANGVAQHRWGLAQSLPFFAGQASLLETEFASLVLGAQRGVSGSLYLSGYRYFVAALSRTSTQTLVLIVNAQEEQLSRRIASQKSHSSEVLRKIGKSLTMDLRLNPMSVASVHTITSALDLTAGLLWVSPGEDEPLELVTSIGVNREGSNLLQTLDPREGSSCVAELVANRHQEIAVRNVFENAMTSELEAKLCYLKPGGLVVLPLVVGGVLIGVLELIGRAGDHEFMDHREIFTTVSEHLALAIHSARLYERAERLATVDPLTGIANHRTLQDFLHREAAKAERLGTSMAVIMLDIDHFRSFNEEEGHDVGDDVLKRVVDAMRSRVRAYDLPARYGGEEFTVVMPGADRRQAHQVAERIREEIENIEIVTRSGRTRHVSASLGVATYPENATDPDRLLKAADAALYAAKRDGRNRTVVAEGAFLEARESRPSDADRVRQWLTGLALAEGEAFLARTAAYRSHLVQEMALSKRQASLLDALVLAAPGQRLLVRDGTAEERAEWENASVLRGVAPSLAALDERYDGTGPRGLAGDRIPLLARVLSVLWALVEEGGKSLVFDPSRFDPEIVALVAEVPEAA